MRYLSISCGLIIFRLEKQFLGKILLGLLLHKNFRNRLVATLVPESCILLGKCVVVDHTVRLSVLEESEVAPRITKKTLLYAVGQHGAEINPFKMSTPDASQRSFALSAPITGYFLVTVRLKRLLGVHNGRFLGLRRKGFSRVLKTFGILTGIVVNRENNFRWQRTIHI